MSTAKSDPISILYSEAVVYTLTAFGVIALVLELLFFTNVLFAERFYFEFISNIIFLNSIHTLFSFRLMQYEPFKKALSRSIGNSPFAFPLVCIGIFAAIFLNLFIFYNSVILPTPWNYINDAFFAFQVGVLPIHHSVTQAYGVLQIYKNNEKKPNQPNEKHLYSLILSFTLISTITYFFLPHANPDSVNLVRWTACGLAVFATILLIVSLIVKRGLKSKSTHFSFRFLLLPFKYISASAGFFSSCCHGVEYYMVSKNIENNCAEKGLKRSSVSKIAFGFFVIALICQFAIFYRHVNNRPADYLSSLPLVFFVSMVKATAVVHYFMDRQFFKFKNLDTRNEIAPLLRLPTS